MHCIPRWLCRLTLAVAPLAPFVLIPVPGAAGQAAATLDQPVQARIIAPVSDKELVTLKGNVHPLALARDDHGAAPAAMPTGRVMLLLRRSDAQSTALHQYLDELQNPASSHYRQWLTPASYGASYGINDADLAKVTGWLAGHGFKIEHVPAARNLIVFSGTVGGIQAAFHTSIHSYVVGGEPHYANASDPQIPAALAPVVAGISPMNDFRAKPDHQLGPRGMFDPVAKRIRPNLTLEGDNSVDLLFVDPADAATIYNTPNAQLNRNYAAPASLDGTGVTIGILGYSDLASLDVINYRSGFLGIAGLSHIVTDGGVDPGMLYGGYAVEALLDNEITAGLAPGATINYYNAASVYFADGLRLAAMRALDDNQVSILNVSYSNCEADLGASGNLLFSELWEQAASQGISVVVSSGDNGSAGCDDENSEELATQGLAVSGIASTPYNLAVGGTDFVNLASAFSTYAQQTGGAAPYYGTALGYIPESTWNDSVLANGPLSQNVAYTDPSTGDTNIVAGSGGLSSGSYCAAGLDANGNCTGVLSGYPKPAFQQSITGSDGVRDLPDVALFSAAGKNNAAWVLCSDSVTDGNTSQAYTNCQTDGYGMFFSGTNFDAVGGTSAAAPAFAGMLALVSQSLGGVRLGQANNVLYNLAAKSSASTIFHTVVGNNAVPCTLGSPDCDAENFLTGYDAGPSYNEAAGLGSINVTALVNAWPSAALTATSTSLSAGISASSLGTGAISVMHGTPLYFGVAVSPAGAVGDVSVTNTSKDSNNAASSSDFVTLGNDGQGTFTSNNLPGGTYTISAYYEGDATHAASASTPPINVTISQEPSTTTINLQAYDPAIGQLASGTTFPYGYYGFLSAQTYGNNSIRDSHGSIIPDGIPLGFVEFVAPGGFILNTSYFNSVGVAQASLNAFPPASYSLFAEYFGGDPNFLPSQSAPLSFTITPAQTTVNLQASATSIATGVSVSILSTLSTDSVGNFPTGTLTLQVSGGGSYNANLVSGHAPNGTVQEQYTFLVPASGLAAGANTLTVTYSGDSSYTPSSATVIVAVSSTAPAPSFALAGPSTGISIATPGQSGTGSITLTPANGFNGIVSLTCSVAAPSTGLTPTCSIPATETITGAASVQAALSVATTAGTAADTRPMQRFVLPAGSLAIGSMLFFALPRRRKSWPALLGLVLLCNFGFAAMGCGGGSGTSSSSVAGGTPGTPAGSYIVTVTGSSGNLSATTKVSVTVQ